MTENEVALQESATNEQPAMPKKSFIKKNYSKLERQDFLFAYLMVLFPVAQFAVFWVFVNASSIALAFQHPTTGALSFVNFKTVYNAFMSSDVFGINLGKSLLRSFVLWIIGEGFIFPVSLNFFF